MRLVRGLVTLAALVAVVSFSPAAAPPTASTDDPLPRGARARLGTTRLRHGDPLTAVAFSRDGKTLATAATDHAVRLWHPGTGKKIGSFGESGAYSGVYQTSRWLSCVAVSADGKTVASAVREGSVVVWEAATGKELLRLRPGEGVVCLDLAPDGKLLATSGSATIRVWDVGTGKDLYHLTSQTESTTRLLFSPDSKTLAAGGGQGTVCLWDVNTKKERHNLAGHDQPINALAFSSDGKRLASGAGETKLVVWDVGTGKEVRRFDGHADGVVGLGLDPDGKTLVSAGSKGAIRICKVGTNDVQVRGGSPDILTAAALSPDGKTLALAGQLGTVFLLDLTKEKQREPDGHCGRVHFVAFTGDGKRVVSAGGEGSFWVWDSANGKPIRRTLLKDESRAIPAAGGGAGVTFAFSATGRFAATRRRGGGIVVYDPYVGKELRVLKEKGGHVTCGSMTADGRALAVGHSDGTVEIWDADKGRQLRKIDALKGTVNSVALAPDGSALASVGTDGTLRLNRVSSGAEIWKESLGDERALKVAFSTDGRCLATGGAFGVVRVWEVASGKQVRQFSRHNGYILSMCFSHDGRSLAVGSWVSVRLWDLASGKERGEQRAHKGDVTSLAFSPDSKTLASGGSDATALLWDVAAAFTAAPAPAELAAKDVEARCADLSGEPAKAYQAIWDLAGAPAEAARMLGKQLKPAPKAYAKRIKALIEDLNSEEFDVRKRASQELEKLGEAAVPALRAALKGADVDLRLQLNVLINDATAAVPPPARLRALRAVQALELAGTREAKALLKTLASGMAESRLTAEAKAALARLDERQGTRR